MPQADGTIVIDTEINTDGTKVGVNEIKASIKRIISQLEELKSSFESAFSDNVSMDVVSDQNKIQSEFSETERSIDSVANADKELNAQLNKGSSAKYEDLQRDINQTESTLQGLDSTAGNVSSSVEKSAEDMSESFNALSDSIDEVNKNGKFGNLMQASETLSGAGEAVLDFAHSTMEMASDVQGAVTKVNGYFGLTGEAAQEMSTVVQNVFKTGVTDSIDEVAEATILVKNNIKDLDNASLENITEQAIVLEQTFGSDMSETMRGVSALMSNFGLDAQTAMDLVVSGTQNGLDKTQELGDNLSEYSGKFAQAGYSAQEYFQLLSNGLENGAYNLDKVNDSINEVTTRLADGTISDSIEIYSEKTQELFTAWQNGGATQKQVIDSIVSDISECQNQQEALNMATTAFGTMAEDGGLKVISSLTSVGNTFDDISGKAESLSDSTTTPMQLIQKAINELQISLAPLGAKLMELAATYLPAIVEKITGLIESFLNLPGPVQTFIAVLAGVLATMSALMPVITAVTTVIGVLGAGALAPIIGIIAGVVAAITGIILAIQNWGSITQWLGDTWNAICTAVQNIWTTVSTAVLAVLTSIVTGIQNGWNTMVNAIQTAMTNIQTTILDIWNAILQNPIVQTIVSTVQQLFENMKNTISGIFDGIKSIAEGAWELIKNVILAPVLLLIDLVTGDFEQLRADASNIWENIKGAASKIWNGILQVLSSIAQGIWNSIKIKFEALKNTVASIWDAIKNTASNIWNSIKDTVSNLVNSAKDAAINGFNNLKDGVSNAISSLPQTISGIFAQMIGAISGFASQAYTWGSDFINGLKDGIMSGVNKIVSTVRGIADKIRSFLHFSVPDQGPLADADEYGPDFIDLLANGMSENLNKIKAVAEKTAVAMQIPYHDFKAFKTPYLSQGTILPPTASIINYNRTNNFTNNSIDGMNRLIGLMEQMIKTKPNNYEFVAKINRRTVFREIIDEAKSMRIQTGKNPFELV